VSRQVGLDILDKKKSLASVGDRTTTPLPLRQQHTHYTDHTISAPLTVKTCSYSTRNTTHRVFVLYYSHFFIPLQSQLPAPQDSEFSCGCVLSMTQFRTWSCHLQMYEKLLCACKRGTRFHGKYKKKNHTHRQKHTYKYTKTQAHIQMHKTHSINTQNTQQKNKKYTYKYAKTSTYTNA
jgi:hypothetical protein